MTSKLHHKITANITDRERWRVYYDINCKLAAIIMNAELMPRVELAERMGVHEKTVRQYIMRGNMLTDLDAGLEAKNDSRPPA